MKRCITQHNFWENLFFNGYVKGNDVAEIKTALFTHQIIITNQSIVPLGSLKGTKRTKNNKKAVGLLWHETIQDCLDENGASVAIMVLREPYYWDCQKWQYGVITAVARTRTGSFTAVLFTNCSNPIIAWEC